MEEIKTQDEYNHVTAQGQRELPGGGITANGPPTTLSGTGVDKMVFAQANMTCDNTRSVNGALVGERNIFQVSLVFSLLAPGIFGCGSCCGCSTKLLCHCCAVITDDYCNSVAFSHYSQTSSCLWTQYSFTPQISIEFLSLIHI